MTARELTGWGNTAPSAADVIEVDDAAQTRAALADPGPRGVLARGLGRSYGDAAENGGGRVIVETGRPLIEVDADGIVTASAGASLDDLMRALVPKGWFVPVTAGTRQVTVGGAVAADIHGKNHHSDGSWGNHVVAIDMLMADGSPLTVTPTNDPELFWATLGGMGLTGVITACQFRAVPIETNRMVVDTVRCADLEATMAEMTDHDAEHRYAVAWIDVLATGRRLGRGVVTLGDHALASMVPGEGRLVFDEHPLAPVPPVVPSGLVNAVTVGAFNELWYRKAPRERRGQLQSMGWYFHTLDILSDWNRVYGRRGMVQYQFVVPFGAEATLRRAVERLSVAGAASFLTVLKRFGPSNPGYLSFPVPGWTLAVDVAAGLHGLGPLLDELDRQIVEAGGRLYFAKDSRMNAALVPAMYPRLDEWRAVCERVDPAGVFQSDLSRRLGLRPRVGAPLGARPTSMETR